MPISVRIVTPSRLLLQCEDATFVGLPGYHGLLEVYPGHTPTLVALRSGPVRIDRGKRPEFVAVHGGVAEILPDAVNIVTFAAEHMTEIDIERARRAKERAEEKLRSHEDVDRARAEAALERALTRLHVASLAQQNE